MFLYCHYNNGIDYTGLSAWSSSTTYSSGNQVHNNVLPPYRWVYGYINETPTSGNPLSSTTYWSLLADGSSGYPYKTITDCCTGLTGGDEIRVAASPPHIPLSGTFRFNNASTTVNMTGYTSGQVTTGDYIGSEDIGFWRISTILSGATPSALTLARQFRSHDMSNWTLDTTYKMSGFTAYLSGNQYWFTLRQNGSGLYSQITISGDWDLTTNTQGSGKTYFYNIGSWSNPRFVSNTSYTSFKFSKLALYYLYGLALNGYSKSSCTWEDFDCGDFQSDILSSWGGKNHIYCTFRRFRIFYSHGDGLGQLGGHTLVEDSKFMYINNDEVFTTQGSFLVRNSIINSPSRLVNPSFSISAYPISFINCSGAVSYFVHSLSYSRQKESKASKGVTFYNWNGIENNTFIYCATGMISATTSIRHTDSGIAWVLTPYSTAYCYDWCPLTLDQLTVAVDPGLTYTASIWCRSVSGQSIDMARFICNGGQVLGVPDTLKSEATSSTSWQQLTLTATPSAKGALEFMFEVYGGAYGYVVDDFSVSSS